MTASSVASFEVGVIAMHLVWCSMLPLIQLSLGASLIAIVTVGSVGRCFFSTHDFRVRMEVDLIQAGKRSGGCDFRVRCK